MSDGVAIARVIAERRIRPTAVRLAGLAALVFSALYVLSDLVEALQGGFSTGQLSLTLVAEAAIPVFVIALCAAQRPQIGLMGWVSAVAYAYSYLFFTGTVIYAINDHTSNYGLLTDDLGWTMTLHGAIMVLAGLGFGSAVIRARVLPRWTGIALMTGVVLVALSQNLPEAAQTFAATIRALGFAGMGAALLRAPPRSFGRPTAAFVRRAVPRRAGEVAGEGSGGVRRRWPRRRSDEADRQDEAGGRKAGR